VSSGEAELPLATGAQQIKQREFATVRRGYDPDQVRAYLGAVGSHVEEIERALAEAMSRIAELEAAPRSPEGDPYERLSQRFAGVLASADSEAAQVVEQARDEAQRIRAEAQARAEDLRDESSRSLTAAREESDRMLESLSQRREAMLRQLHDMQSRLLSVADDLEVAIQPEPDAGAPPRPPEVVVTPELQPATAEASAEGASGSAGDEAHGTVRAHPASSAAAPVTRSVGTERAPSPPVEVGLAALFEEPPADEVDLPDLSDIDLDLDLGEDPGTR
jgi:cell division initiation protein